MSNGTRDGVTRFTRSMANVPGFWRVTRLLERWFPVPVSSNDEDRFVLIDNYDGNIKLRIDITSYMGGCVYWQGYYSREELLLLDRILEPHMTFVDVGANNGYFTTYAAKRLPYGTVLSFEPVPDIFANLEFNVRLNGFKNVRLFRLGLSDASRESVKIYSSNDEMRDALATLFPGGSRQTQVGQIDLDRLDQVLENEGIERVDIIKIDIEGGELSALRGAELVLKRCSPDLIIEFNSETFNSAGYSVHELAEYLVSFGYSFYAIGKRGSLKETS